MDGFDQRVANAHARFAAVELARAEERAALAANPAQAIPSSLGVRSGGLSSTLVSSLRELEHSQLSRVHQRNLTAGTPRASAAVAGTPRASAVAASCSRAAAAQATVPLPFASAATGTTHSYNVRPGAKPRPESASVVGLAHRRIVTPSLMARTLSLRSEIANSQLDRAPSGAGLGYTQSATLSAQQQQQSARFAGSYAHSRSRFSSGATSRAGTAASTPRTLGAGSGIPPAGRKKPRPNSAYAISDSKREADAEYAQSERSDTVLGQSGSLPEMRRAASRPASGVILRRGDEAGEMKEGDEMMRDEEDDDILPPMENDYSPESSAASSPERTRGPVDEWATSPGSRPVPGMRLSSGSARSRLQPLSSGRVSSPQRLGSGAMRQIRQIRSAPPSRTLSPGRATSGSDAASAAATVLRLRHPASARAASVSAAERALAWDELPSDAREVLRAQALGAVDGHVREAEAQRAAHLAEAAGAGAEVTPTFFPIDAFDSYDSESAACRAAMAQLPNAPPPHLKSWSEDEATSLRAHSRYYFADGTWQWAPCRAIAFDADRRHFTIEFGEGRPGGPAGSALVFSGRRVSETQLAGAQPSVRKPASRLNLLLDSEDPLAFSARVLAALERRRSVEAQLHYALLLNTLPVDSASSLAQPTLGSIHRRANLRLASVSEPREEMWTPVVDALWTEVRADWRRAHAAIDFEERDYAAPWRLEGAREPHFGRITSAHVRVFEPFALAAGVAGATRVTAESQSESTPRPPTPWLAVKLIPADRTPFTAACASLEAALPGAEGLRAVRAMWRELQPLTDAAAARAVVFSESGTEGGRLLGVLLLRGRDARAEPLAPQEYEAVQARQTRACIDFLAKDALPDLAAAVLGAVGVQPQFCTSSALADAYDLLASIADLLLRRALRALVRLSVNAWAAPFVDADFETSTGDAVDPGIREDDEVGAAPPLLRVELCYATERGGAHFEPTLETAAEAVLCTLSAACERMQGEVPLMMRAWRAPGLDWYEGYDAADLVPPELPAPAFPLRSDGALRVDVLGDAPARVAAALAAAAERPLALAAAFNLAAARLPADAAAHAAALVAATADDEPDVWRREWCAAIGELREAREVTEHLFAGECVRLGAYEVGVSRARTAVLAIADAALDALCAAATQVAVAEVHALNAEAEEAVAALQATSVNAEAWSEQRKLFDGSQALAIALEARGLAAAERMAVLEAAQRDPTPELLRAYFDALGGARRVAQAGDVGEVPLERTAEKLQTALRTQRDAVGVEVEATVALVTHLRTHYSDQHLDEAELVAASTAVLDERLKRTASEAAVVRQREKVFGWELSQFESLDRAAADFAPLSVLWRAAAEILTAHARALDGALLEVDLGKLEIDVGRWSAEVARVGRQLRARAGEHKVANAMSAPLAVAEAAREVVQRMRSYLPTLRTLRAPGLKARHWLAISEEAGHQLDPTRDASLSLEHVLVLKLDEEAWLGVQQVAETAGREHSIERALERMLTYWRGAELDIAPHAASRSQVLRAMEEVQAAMDEHTARCLALAASPYAKPVEEALANLLVSLRIATDTLDAWFGVQRGWLHLQPLFAAADIVTAMPAEARRFAAIDRVWRQTMMAAAARPNLLRFCASGGRILETMRESARHLDGILRNLAELLEAKRLAFPRFFFLADDELLQLLSRARDPRAVQPHLHKCFEGVVRLVFAGDALRADGGAELAPPARAAAGDEEGSGELDEEEAEPGADVGLILALCSADGEVLPLETAQQVDPNLGFRKGRAETWLGEVEAAMRRAVRAAISTAVAARGTEARGAWALHHTSQAVIVANALFWTADVETALAGEASFGTESRRRIVTEGASVGGLMRALLGRLGAELGEVVELVRGALPPRARMGLGALIVRDVHQRDVVSLLVAHGVVAALEFDWQAQLRYYDMDAAGVEPPAGGGGGKAAAGSAVGGRLHVSMVSATRPFAFEYLGTTTRLIVTPLTDRCYQTLLGAIHLNLGGAPEGPAGTGKTETVKDLAKAVATQCVVFNCSEGLDVTAMGQFFKGLASCGAWSCFDEFNRIDVEVLSVVAQQILSIQIALGGGVGVFSFEGTTLRLHAGCAVFITMNPGYAGRAELPDNLQALFRPCAMMMPDCALIAEISLHAGGFHEARTCAAKLVGCLRLCSEQLSSRDHYDWGMRAVKAVIIAAAVLKAQLRERRSSVDSLPERASAARGTTSVAEEPVNVNDNADGESGELRRRSSQVGEDELALTLGALRACTLPKLSAADVPIFSWIARDLFPGSASAPSGRLPELADAIGTACESLRLQPLPPFVAKCEQLNATLGTRHGVMLIGGAMAGKTAALRALREALALVGAPRDKLPLLVTHRLNPKALPLSQLYGAFDTASREWTDGVVAELMRGLVDGARRAAEATEALAVYLQPPPWRGWLVFDGPVDALWIESMNTALDDSKRLCLASGEVIRLPEGISLIFEAADLAAASPATVSRTGMVFFEAENLGWRALVRSWLGRLPKVLALNAPDLERCAEALLPPLLAVALSASKALISSSELTLVTSFLALIDALLRPHLSADEDADAAAAAAADETAREDEAAVEDATSSAESSLASSRQQSRRASRMDTLERQNSLLTAAASDPSTDAQAMRAGSSGLPFGTKPSVPQRLIAPNAISGLATFAALWALGGPLDAVARARVCAKLAELCSVKSAGNTPPHIDGALPGVVTLPAFDGSLFDFSFDAARNEWTPWVPPGEPVPPTAGTPFAQIVIPTAESARIGYLLRALCDAGTHALLVGESGVGKSTIVRQALGPGGWGGALGKSGRPPLQIAIPFSARTPATLLRAVVDSRMRKRRRGVYGPPHVGQRALVCVDDLAGPALEEFGAQPPLELLRQLLDSGGWYSPSAPGEFRALVDTQLVGTMRPEGTGAAQSLPPRLRRHLVALGLAPASAADLERVYGAIVSAHLTTGALDEVHTLGASVVRATVALFVAAREALLPTPTKPHYTFNARDVASVAEGVVGVPASALSSREALLRLWAHEAARVFADRLVATEDVAWFDEALARVQREQLLLADGELVDGRALLFGAVNFGALDAPSALTQAAGVLAEVEGAEDAPSVDGSTPGSADGTLPHLPISTDVSTPGLAVPSRRGSTSGSTPAGTSASGMPSRRGSTAISRRDSAVSNGFAAPREPDGPLYVEVTERGALRTLMEQQINEHNESIGALIAPARPLSLVLFDAAVEHVCRAHRVLRRPGGHLLLLGLPGVGRRSSARLAAALLEMVVLEPTASASGAYGQLEWRDDVRRWVVRAGRDGTSSMLLLSDGDLARGSALDDVHELLSSGAVFGLFAAEEADTLLFELRAVAATEARDGVREAEVTATDTADAADVWAWCAGRVRERLHLVLCVSPADANFKERLRAYPSLVDCCSIDALADWPDDALLDVATAKLAPLLVEAGPLAPSLPELAAGAAGCHRACERAFMQFGGVSGRTVAVTAGSYLNMLELLLNLVRGDASAVIERQRRYAAGLHTLATTSEQVRQMSSELEELQPLLLRKTAEVDAEAAQIAAEQRRADRERAQVEVEEAQCLLAAQEAEALKRACEADLSTAMPALESAVAALKALRKEDIVEVKSMKNPPDGVRLTLEAVCILRCVLPSKKAVRTSLGQMVHVEDYWDASRKMLAERNFIGSLLSFKKDNVADSTLTKLTPYVDNPAFQPDPIGRASKAAHGLCKWVRAVHEYCVVAALVAPKRAALREAEAVVAAASAALAEKKAALAASDLRLAKLKAALDAAVMERGALQAQVGDCGARLRRAELVVSGLGGERQRWERANVELILRISALAGDMALSAAAVAYFGPLDGFARTKARRQCETAVARAGLRASAPFDLRTCIGEQVAEEGWRALGLPADAHSAENALIMHKAVRWPYLLDPHGLASVWVRRLQTGRSLIVTRMGASSSGGGGGGGSGGGGGEFMRTLENAMMSGAALLCEHAPEVLDDALRALLAREVSVSGGVPCVRLGGRLLELSKEFRLYFATANPSPHIPPETAACVCVLNFASTAAGLEEQLLRAVVAAECPSLAEARTRLIEEGAFDKKRLGADEARILELIGSSTGNVLDDDSLVRALDSARATAAAVAAKARVDQSTATQIEAASTLYLPVAARATQLFGAVSALRYVDRVYQWDLAWFLRLFRRCVGVAQEKAKSAGRGGDDVAESRIAHMRELLLRAVYDDVHRALRSADKLTFDVSLASRLRAADGHLEEEEWAVFARVDAEMPAPSDIYASNDEDGNMRHLRPEWLPSREWAAVCALSAELPVFAPLAAEMNALLSTAESLPAADGGLPPADEEEDEGGADLTEGGAASEVLPSLAKSDEEMGATGQTWQRLFNSTAPHREQFSNSAWAAKLSTLQRLLIIKALRPDACAPLLREFVRESLGDEFGKPAAPTLVDALTASEPFTPILLLLTPGADPTAELLAFAAEGGRAKLDTLSLGQGMGPRASSLLEYALKHGSWVLLQNCHLATSWMPQLEAQVERLRELAAPGFRLWLTSAPSNVLPSSVLQTSVKLMTEPARGLRANLGALWARADDRYFDQCAEPRALRRLFYGLSLFHATVLERRRFGAIGWNLLYAFSSSDFDISARQLRVLIDEAVVAAQQRPPEPSRMRFGGREKNAPLPPPRLSVPWEAITHVVGELNYGGRVTDERDRRLLACVLSDFMGDEALSKRHVFCEGASAAHSPPPADADVGAVRKWVGALPADAEAAEAVGLHPNAQILSARAELQRTIAGIASARPTATAAPCSSAASGVLALAESIERRLNAQFFDLEAVGADLPPSYDESMNVVLAHELARYNQLLAAVRDGLRAVGKAILGLTVMSLETERTVEALQARRVPAAWAQAAYPSRKALGAWVNDLERRLAFFSAWVKTGAPPRVFWVSGFFSTQSFITGIRQNYARKNGIAIDQLSLHTDVLAARAMSEVGAAPEDGAYVSGLFLEGCSWDRTGKQLRDARPKELYAPLPVLWLRPSLEPPPTADVYETPVYRTTERDGKLSTTGHSVNFVLMATLPTDQPAKFWVKRGVALLCALDE